MSIPKELRYVDSHEWVRVDGDVATVGITDHAQQALGDVVFVQLPEVGDQIDQGGEAGEIESVKAVSAIYAPISGEVIEVNGALDDDPETVNQAPYGGGWLFKIRLSRPAEIDGLLSADGYAAVLADA